MSRLLSLKSRLRGGLLGSLLAVFLTGAVGQDSLAAEPRDTPPMLPVSASSPLPEYLRRQVPESLDELVAIQERVQSLVESLQAVTVGIRRGPAQGTGVIIGRNGYVLTAAHVSGPPGRRVTLITNNGSPLEGVSLGRHKVLDAGLVKITQAGDWPVAKVSDGRSLKEGDWVVGTGHPGGFDGERLPVVRLGRVIGKMTWIIHTDVTLVGGDSGGPLFDLNGQVVAVHSRIGPGAELNFHVPMSAYIDNWHWMTAGEDRPVSADSGGPVLGVDGEDVRKGCRVIRVFPDRPAAAAGLETGDIITQIDDRFIFGLEDLIASVNHYSPGDTVTVKFKRDGELKSLRVTLAERAGSKDSDSRNRRG